MHGGGHLQLNRFLRFHMGVCVPNIRIWKRRSSKEVSQALEIILRWCLITVHMPAHDALLVHKANVANVTVRHAELLARPLRVAKVTKKGGVPLRGH